MISCMIPSVEAKAGVLKRKLYSHDLFVTYTFIETILEIFG